MEDEIHLYDIIGRPFRDVSSKQEEYLSVKNSFVGYEQTAEGKAKRSVIEEKRANLTIVPEVDNSELVIKRSELVSKKDEALKKLGLKDEYDRQIAKIANLQDELKANAVEVAKIEGKIAKAKEYEQERANIVNDKVSSKFNYVSIKMSELNKSGEFVPACIITDNDGVNALVSNNASRILCGIDISLAFQNYFGTSVPMFIDNAESVNEGNYPEIGSQVIKMFVDECKFTIN